MKIKSQVPRPLLILCCAGLLAVTASTTVPALRERLWPTPKAQAAQPAYALLAARAFQLDQSYVSYDRAEQPQVRSGWVLALRVPPQLAALRNSLMPVLCVGANTAERWNSGGPSGQIIVTVPCELGTQGRPQLDLTQAPIWFASAELPERVDAAWIAAERERASQLQAFPRAEIERAIERGGATLHAIDHSELGNQLSQWVEQYSPEELEYAESLRTTVSR